MNKPLITVVMPAHNAAEFIQSSIESVLNQTYQNIELIVIDDHSTDSTSDIIQSQFKDNQHVHYYPAVKKNVSNARNQGISLAKGSYISFLDADDTYNSSYIDTLLQGISGNDLSLCSFTSDFINTDEHIVNTFTIKGNVQMKTLDSSFWKYFDQYIYNPCWNKLYRKDIIDQYHVQFPVEQTMGEDLSFNLKYMVHCHSIAVINEPLYSYTRHANQTILKPDPHYYDSIEKMYMDIHTYMEANGFLTESFEEEWNHRFFKEIIRSISKINQTGLALQEKKIYITKILNNKNVIANVAKQPNNLLTIMVRHKMIVSFIIMYRIYKLLKK